jgi:hypothetical protein
VGLLLEADRGASSQIDKYFQKLDEEVDIEPGISSRAKIISQ